MVKTLCLNLNLQRSVCSSPDAAANLTESRASRPQLLITRAISRILECAPSARLSPFDPSGLRALIVLIVVKSLKSTRTTSRWTLQESDPEGDDLQRLNAHFVFAHHSPLLFLYRLELTVLVRHSAPRVLSTIPGRHQGL